MFFSDQVRLPVGPQEGPETALCGTVKAARWQQDNIGVLFHSMTSHKKTTLARSTHQNNSERTSKLLEEQCHEFVSLVSVRFQGLKKCQNNRRHLAKRTSERFGSMTSHKKRLWHETPNMDS